MTVNLLPGPVTLSLRVRKALASPALSHRSAVYHALLGRAKERLLALTDAESVEVLLGSGTLANDLVAGQLSLLAKPGLIVSNGEFGERLLLHARGFDLMHATQKQEWGTAIDMAALEDRLDARPDLRWIWAAHCETSTGMMNPMEALREVCRRRGLLLCLDCISSLGAVPVDLTGVFLATGVSGKGLGAYTGLSMVFYRKPGLPVSGNLPRYLDLRYYAGQGGVPFSGSSNLLSALVEALEERHEDSDGGGLYFRREALSRWLCRRFREEGIPVLLDRDRDACSPAVFTIPIPTGQSSAEEGDFLEAKGILVNYNGGYLLKRNWIQVCLMGDHSRGDLEPMIRELSFRLSGVRTAT